MYIHIEFFTPIIIHRIEQMGLTTEYNSITIVTALPRCALEQKNTKRMSIQIMIKRKILASRSNFRKAKSLLFFLFQNAKYLKELYLSRNQFGSAAGEILGPAISELPRTCG